MSARPRALTGRTATRENPAARRHDSTPKTVLGQTANFDAGSFVDLVLSRPSSAPFVAGRLWFRLVSATPQTAVYGPGRDIRSLLTALVNEDAFHDSATSLVKQPVEWLGGLLRALRVRPSALDAKSGAQLLTRLRGMGQVPFPRGEHHDPRRAVPPDDPQQREPVASGQQHVEHDQIGPETGQLRFELFAVGATPAPRTPPPATRPPPKAGSLRRPRRRGCAVRLAMAEVQADRRHRSTAPKRHS
ncbi:Protein of unknown function [Amycolatopsis rubida]|uniref:Uncharacterized protein n=1 Tax=Amycolatopsis rubida TaxID=112413 RepID=A0A1I5KA70_9PSEU|nr:Protein of unknown function [Amycolatopsis rubida]